MKCFDRKSIRLPGFRREHALGDIRKSVVEQAYHFDGFRRIVLIEEQMEVSSQPEMGFNLHIIYIHANISPANLE